MGLDAELIRVRMDLVCDDLSFVSSKDVKDLVHWRKNYELENWMSILYHKKGGKGEFNCEYVSITEEDLDAILSSSDPLVDLEQNRTFLYDELPREPVIEVARQALQQGYALYYSSSW